jgi:hypothetical protein
MSQYQKIEVPLSLVTWSAGGKAAIDFGALQPQLAGRIAHVVGFKFVVAATPTLSSGTATPEELQGAVNSMVIKDGTGRMLFNGSFKSNRLQDALERGYLSAPEPDGAATTEAVHFERIFKLGPDSFFDGTDFVQPAAVFRGGSISFGFGALTDVDANCTALTLTVQPYVVCQLHDELILGALVERYESLYTNGQVIGAESLYTDVGLCDSATFGAIAAGDFANVTVIANGFTRDAIHVADLERMYHADKMTNSGLSLVHGEPRAATDDNPKVVSGTALAAAPAQISPVIWTPQNAKLSKLLYAAQPNIVLKWSGTQSTAYMLATRILPRTDSDFGKAIALCRSGLGINNVSGPVARTLSKADYKGPRRGYMPLKLKVG